MSKKKVTPKTNSEVFQSVRGSWFGVNPVTKVIPNKKKNQKTKHKKKEFEENV